MMLEGSCSPRQAKSQAWSQLRWLPIRFGAHFKVLVLTYKVLRGSGPQRLKDHLSPYEPIRTQNLSSKAFSSKNFSIYPLLERLGGWQHKNGSFLGWLPVCGMLSPERLAWHHQYNVIRHQIKTFLFTQAFGH
ncbi:Hypothetical predicted protein [Podarcis lilfordi]|uniref:Uncharacterized protein n=1 Tax=Podarcis lilfordi TaxID=74358 RepID=A0AA35JVT1_9SAUR|nr:Hypothetical predicted protein [Podarcis lilfordi]